MKYIKKGTDEPAFFTTATQGLTDWDDYKTGKKKLRKHILDNEQYNLCCYCEKRISADSNESYVEHIKPKSVFPDLTFVYSNLLVSCQGNHCNHASDLATKHICGHKKDNEYDANLFLDPTLITDISEHFKFDRDGVISAAEKDKAKENYTISLLNLNGDNNRLAEARKIALTALRN